MSKITVSTIDTENATTPLVLSTGNTQGGFLKIESSNSNILFSGNLAMTGAVLDGKGDVRNLPVFSQSSSYALTVDDVGEVLSTSANVFVPNTIFAAGQAVTIYNNSATAITINQNSSVTMYLAGTATTGNRTLAQRGLATVLCVAANTFVVAGSGVT